MKKILFFSVSVFLVFLYLSIVSAYSCAGESFSCYDWEKPYCNENIYSWDYGCEFNKDYCSANPSFSLDCKTMCENGLIIDYSHDACCPQAYPFVISTTNGGLGCSGSPQKDFSDNFYTRQSSCFKGDDKCVGSSYSVCKDSSSYIWKYVSAGEVVGKCGVECIAGQEKCVGLKQFICSNNKWVEQAYIIGKCGVECLSKSDCPAAIIREKKCSEDDITIESTSYSCESNKCIQKIENNIIQTCQYGCLDAVCLAKIINNIDVYRLEDNECIEYNIPEDEKLLLDYSDLKSCLDEVVINDIIIGDVIIDNTKDEDITKELNIFERIWNSITTWWSNLFN